MSMHEAVQRILGQTRSPRLVEPLLERSALVRPAIVIIACGHDRANSLQMRWMGNRGQHLRGPDVRASIHSDSAIRIWQRCRPLNSVVAIVRFLKKGIPFSVRGVASANILVDDDVTAGCSFVPKVNGIVVMF